MGVDFCDGGGWSADEHEFGVVERGDGVRVLETVALGEEFLVGRGDGGRLLEGFFEVEDGGVGREGDSQSLSAETDLEGDCVLSFVIRLLYLGHHRL